MAGAENVSEHKQEAVSYPSWTQELFNDPVWQNTASLLEQKTVKDEQAREQKVILEQEVVLECPGCAKVALSQIDASTVHVSENVKILIVGRTGSGKSTLVNTLFGLDIAPVEKGGESCKNDDLVMKHILPPIPQNEKASDGTGTQVEIYEGLGDSDKDEQALRHIKNNVKKVHLLLVCHRLYNKVDHSTDKMLQALAEYYTKDVFTHMIVLLTHADAHRVYIRSSQVDVVKRDFEGRYESMKSLLRCAIAKVPGVKADEITFCLTCDDTRRVLPHTSNWEYELWRSILHKCDKEAKIMLSCFARAVRKIELI